MLNTKNWIVAALILACVGGGIGMALLPSETPPPAQNAPAPTQDTLSPIANGELESGYERLELIEVGVPAPLVKAETADKKPFSNESYLGKEGLVLIFYQGSFCSVCQHQLESYQAKLGEFKKLGFAVAAVSADDIVEAKKRQGESGLTFPVLHDEAHAVIDAFGATNRTRHGIAYPVVYFLNKEGRVLLAYADPEMARLEAPDALKKIASFKKG